MRRFHSLSIRCGLLFLCALGIVCVNSLMADTLPYRVYMKRAIRGVVPAERNTDSGWVPARVANGGECVPSGGVCSVDTDCQIGEEPTRDKCVVYPNTVPQVTFDCLGDEDIYLAVSVVFDSGIETSVVSESPEVYRCYVCNGTDSDSDGFCTEAVSDVSPDCDDTRAEVHTNAAQVCDGLNNDCSHPSWPSLLGTNDGDDDGDGFSECDGDCDDSNPSVFPGSLEVCDGVNNNCSDRMWPQLPDDEIDLDGDGFSYCGGDCDDSNNTTYPGAPDICDRINNNCDDPRWPTLSRIDSDIDQDGVTACEGDCNDLNPLLSPIAADVCNGQDDNCNGLIDDDIWGQDYDGDGIFNTCDNCKFAANPSQSDWNGDGIGDACGQFRGIPH